MSAPAIPRPDWEQAWVNALMTLELEVDRAEALLVAGALPVAATEPATTWVAPVLQGPLPESLRARAEAIAVRQQQVAAELSRAITVARRDLAVAERMDWRPDRSTPAFLDADF
jgi:hypothetical protein